MNVIDLFAGVGGMSQGFLKAGYKVVAAIEYDQEIAEAYKLNHEGTDVYADDIKNIDIDEFSQKYKNIGVIIGGPPCQGFSQKGKRLSLNDERNYLFQYFVKFVDAIRPKYFVLENVPNITTTSGGFFKKEIVETFEKLGYNVDCKVLLASKFGVPQHRKRAFFVGSLTGKIDLPVTNSIKTSVKDAIYDLPFIESGDGLNYVGYSAVSELTQYQKMMRDDSKGIFNHVATKHSPIAIERLKLIPKGKGREVLPKEHLTKSIYSGTWSRLIEDEPSATITTRFDTPSSGLFTHPILNRCLTVREAARLQSFTDKFVFYGTKSSQMKQVGNAVPPLLAYEVAKCIYNHSVAHEEKSKSDNSETRVKSKVRDQVINI